MKKTLSFISIMLLLLSCSNNIFTIKVVFDEQLHITDSTEIGIAVRNGEHTDTYTGYVINNLLKISFPIQEEQLIVLDLGELGRTMIAVEKGKIHAAEVCIDINVNEDNDVIITKQGSINNDFIQMYDDYEAQLYEVLNQNLPTEDKDTYFEQIIDKIYRTLKGEENSLTNINTLAGKYGFLNFYPLFGLLQADTLCSLMNENTLKDADIQQIYSNVQLQKSLSAGNRYKNITAKTPTDEILSLSDLIGKTDYVLVDFWASWCGPCRASIPLLKALYNQYNDRLEILGVSLDNRKEAWLNAIQSMDMNWYHISDLQGWQAEGAKIYGINAIPCTLLIDKQGIIIGRNMDLQDIEQLLKE